MFWFFFGKSIHKIWFHQYSTLFNWRNAYKICKLSHNQCKSCSEWSYKSLLYLILDTESRVFPLAVFFRLTVSFILGFCAIKYFFVFLIISYKAAVHETRFFSKLHFPGHLSAGGVDQEVGELPHYVGQGHEGEEIQFRHGEITHRSSLIYFSSIPEFDETLFYYPPQRR